MPDYLSQFVEDELSNPLGVIDKKQVGIAGFNTMVVVRQGIMKSNSAAVIPLEDGSYAIDHIIQNPLALELEGSVCDVFHRRSPLKTAYIKTLAQVGEINNYLPDYTRQQILAINNVITNASNTVRKIDNYINSGEQLYAFFYSDSKARTIPEKFIEFISSLMDTKQVVQIEMPYKVYGNMAITSFQVIHPQEFDNAIEFKITAVQLQYAKTTYEDVSQYYKEPASAVKDQTSGKIDKGINKTETAPVSLGSRIVGALS